MEVKEVIGLHPVHISALLIKVQGRTYTHKVVTKMKQSDLTSLGIIHFDIHLSITELILKALLRKVLGETKAILLILDLWFEKSNEFITNI